MSSTALKPIAHKRVVSAAGETPCAADDTLPAQPLISIRPSRTWVSLNLRDLWAYRELLYFLTWRDVKVRYKQTVLGAAWAIIQPLAAMLLFTLFFGKLAGMPVRRHSLSSLRLRRPFALDLLCQRRDQQRQQPGRQRQPDHQGLFPADDHSRRGGRRGPGRLRHRLRACWSA